MHYIEGHEYEIEVRIKPLNPLLIISTGSDVKGNGQVCKYLTFSPDQTPSAKDIMDVIMRRSR